MAMRRLRKEFDEVSTFGITDVKSLAPLGDNMLEWRGKFYGPEESPYEGGLFTVDLVFPSNYPFSAPSVKFRTCIYHPSVCRSTGKLCSEILESGWTPNKDVKWVMKSLSDVLMYPSSTSPLDMDIARMYERNRKEFNKVAKEWTKLYAR